MEWVITVTLAMRPVGAFIFGLLGDRFGRRIPLMIDIIFYSIMELLTAFAPNYTMLQFQKLQGDARDYAYAHSGGEGTVGGPDPGAVLVEHGTCAQELWPDDDDSPRARDSKPIAARRESAREFGSTCASGASTAHRPPA